MLGYKGWIQIYFLSSQAREENQSKTEQKSIVFLHYAYKSTKKKKHVEKEKVYVYKNCIGIYS